MKTIFLIAYLFVVCSNGHCDKVNNDIPIQICSKAGDEMIKADIIIRVALTHNHLTEFIDKKDGIYDDYYDGDHRVKRSFVISDDAPEENESTVFFDLFYDENGDLIYAYICHYRSANYGIYFQNNELFYVKAGPFHMGDPYLKGNLEQAKAFIKQDELYSFVLDDLDVCLENED